jgi:peptidoglycan/xylan/chitin deacetylase (PgdA/CDA1 family)
VLHIPLRGQQKGYCPLDTPSTKTHSRDVTKRVTKLCISAAVFFCTLVADTIRRIGGGKPAATCVILGYHAVSAECRGLFARQMDVLLRQAIPISADKRGPLLPGRHYVAVTFDDGLLCVVENAIPELVQRQIPATLFIVADLLGSKPKWTMFGEDYDAQEPIAEGSHLKNLPADLITIGSHTLSHPWLPALSESQARLELFGSRERLKELISREIRLFSFPYGAATSQLVDLCREAGYERVFTILPTLAFADPQEYVTGRVVVDPTDWPLEFHLKLHGAYRWLPRVFKWKRKIFPAPFVDPISEAN